MPIKTKDLIGAQLDWAVAKCEGLNVGVQTISEQQQQSRFLPEEMHLINWHPKLCIIEEDGYKNTTPVDAKGYRGYFGYSTDWAQGGSIIEQNDIELTRESPGLWLAKIDLDEGDFMVETAYGSTQLIAAMRCYVASKLGEEIEVPDGLL